MTNLSVKKPKEPNLRIPEFRGEWEEKELRELAEINPNTPKPEGEFIYLDLASVKKGVIVNYQKLTSENAPSRAKRILKQQDILFAKVRPYQQNNLLFKEKDGQAYVASTVFSHLRAKLCETKFLYHSLHTDKIKQIVVFRLTG
ncbi:MAG: hypothetical protein U9532_03880 ['Conium maculatum' witches'-broom phytoplasma]|nr:hypothetical protein ['Conium maculatum' witches'-broom phytoplasma]